MRCIRGVGESWLFPMTNRVFTETVASTGRLVFTQGIHFVDQPVAGQRKILKNKPSSFCVTFYFVQ